MPRHLVYRVLLIPEASAPFSIPDLQQSFRSSFGFLRCGFGTILVQLLLLLFLVGIHPCRFHGINVFLGFGRVGNFREDPDALFAEEERSCGEGTAGRLRQSFLLLYCTLYNYSTRTGTVGFITARYHHTCDDYMDAPSCIHNTERPWKRSIRVD